MAKKATKKAAPKKTAKKKVSPAQAKARANFKKVSDYVGKTWNGKGKRTDAMKKAFALLKSGKI